jgi:hypothetical protein
MEREKRFWFRVPVPRSRFAVARGSEKEPWELEGTAFWKAL